MKWYCENVEVIKRNAYAMKKQDKGCLYRENK